MNVCWISAGVSSFMADVLGSAEKWVYIDITDQHPDSMRFIKDCEKAIGVEIEILKSTEYKDVEDVCRKTGTTNTRYGAPCTGMLKKRVRKQWERTQTEPLTYIWGYDLNEKKRAEAVVRNFPEFEHKFPLIEKNLSKEAVHGLFDRMFDVPRPKMYEMGYSNNNCIGCVKGGMGYWNKIRVDFPDVFERRAKMERDIGWSCLKDCFLDELAPNSGVIKKEIMPDCDIMCYVTWKDMQGETEEGGEQE